MTDEGTKNRSRPRRFDEIAVLVNDRIDDPSKAGVERYVGLEHLDSGSLTISRWGAPSDVEATKLRFRAGDIIFGRRRAYQRKLAVAEFDGICSAHAMVLRARPDAVVPEFLPFFMQSELFMKRAQEISVGSLSPTINWKTLAKEEFAMPPMEEQRRISEALLALQMTLKSLLRVKRQTAIARESFASWLWSSFPRRFPVMRLVDACQKVQDGTHFSPRTSSGNFRYVTSRNIHDGYLDLGDSGWISKEEHESIYKRADVRLGDVLITKDGANAGNVAINHMDEPFSLLSSVAFIRPDPKVLLSRYLFEYLRSAIGRARILSHVKGSAITRLTLTQLRKFEVPSPPLAEQTEACKQFVDFEKGISLTTNRIGLLSQLHLDLVAELNWK